ncbi:C-terminal domain of homeodomain 1-domain-containing protein [Gymnopilus junonius]|uniref:C-terminal domain of homeodomain 1-domain-containing protein n=1 Tax=Gymnopilus junonius TaxID=109634 RepID=A0A9P5N6S5_GYMJU|nr:C-terminal domain of homeodomain 1-domain-containing protein [Gymnopilus junonius]
MTSNLDEMFNKTIRRHVDNFFASFQKDGIALTSFLESWLKFNNTLGQCRDSLQQETLLNIHGCTSVISSVASEMLELHQVTDQISQDLVTDVTKILDEKMAKLSIRDADEQQQRSSTASVSNPSYIKPSYQWLLLNLYNPYPTKDMKKSIAYQSRCSLKDIDSWFMDARKKIGWNRIRKDHFSNKQEKIVAAATQFYKPSLDTFSDDLSTNLESEVNSNIAYDAEFIAMEDAARSMYSGRFIDMPSSISSLYRSGQRSSSKKPANGGRIRKRSSFSQSVNDRGEPYTKVSPTSTRDPAFSYLTPEPSPGWSVELLQPSSVPSSLPSEHVTPSEKRRQTPVELSGDGEQALRGQPVRPRKRSRPDTWEFTDATAPYSLPSPAPSITSLEDTSESNIQRTNFVGCSTPTASASSPTKRKRRLSDGDSRGPAKRPHHALAVPRLQAVSDPLPIFRPFTDDFLDEWFHGNFTEHPLGDVVRVPTSHEVHDLPDAVPLEVHCHGYGISLYPTDAALPETSFLAHDNVSHKSLRLEASADELSETFTPESLFISNSLPDVNVNAAETANTNELSLSLDFGFPLTVEETTSRDKAFNLLDQIIKFGTLPQLPPPVFNWMQLPVSGPVDVMEPSTSFMTENPNISDFDSTTHKGSMTPEDQDVKRLRLQFLREELQLLESEIDP